MAEHNEHNDHNEHNVEGENRVKPKGNRKNNKNNKGSEPKTRGAGFRIMKMVKKEFRLLKTDPMNLMIALVLPPLIIWLFAFMMSMASAPLPVQCVVISYDSNTFINPNTFVPTKFDNYTMPYVDAVNSSDKLELVSWFNASEDIYAMETARNMLKNNQIQAILVIPLEFSEMLLNGMPGTIEAIPDSSNIQNIQDNLNAVQDSINIFVEENNLTPQFVFTEYQEFAIPAGYSFEYNYNITMTLAFIIFGISTVLTILVVVQEKPIARLLLTPVKRSEILLSKYITYSIILAIQVALVITATMLNGLYLVGSLFNLYVALFVIGFTGVTIGIFISTLSNTKTEANQMFFAVFIIVVILSGIFIPIDAMPPFLQVIAYILPLSHGDPMIRGIVTKGKSFIGFDFWCLIALGIGLLILSFIIIKKKDYEV